MSLLNPLKCPDCSGGVRCGGHRSREDGSVVHDTLHLEGASCPNIVDCLACKATGFRPCVGTLPAGRGGLRPCGEPAIVDVEDLGPCCLSCAVEALRSILAARTAVNGYSYAERMETAEQLRALVLASDRVQ